MAEKLWLVRDKKGRIFGPYNEQEICFHIEEGEFKGEEFFSSYPAGKWKPLAAHPVFYEKVLVKFNEKEDTSYQSKKTISVEEYSDESDEEPLEPTRIIAPKEAKFSPKKEKIKIKLSKEFKEEVLAREESSDVIEMEDLDRKFFDTLKSSLKIPLVLFGLLFLVFIFFNQSAKNQNEERVRLLFIKQKREPWPKEELEAKWKNGLRSYFKGTVSDYLNSQVQYVQILEGNPEEEKIYLYLCLVYLELWPFAYQDTIDKNVLNSALNQASQKDKGGIYSGVCKSVQALINNRPEHSLMITNSSLDVTDNQHPVFFYYINAQALKALNRKSQARSYLQSIYKLQPKWAAPYMLDAQIFYEERRYELSAKLYQKVLSFFPEHTSANLRLGVLEYKYFKKLQNSEMRLKSVLMNLNDFVEPDILIEAYIALANIYLGQNNRKGVLEYLNEAYALDPENPDVVLLKSNLGEEGNFENVEVQARGLIYKGDMLVSQGNCSEAKEYFKKAYSAGNKRNALAALKTAQCYWQSGASGQAVRWLKRSINADRKMLEAYFLLADYLSDLYDFENARDILTAVRGQKPSNYDLFKTYALLSFRQKQYSAAVAYAERSLKFYTSDVEIYILLSEAYLALKKGHKSFFYAEKAVQEDVNSVSAQISYALALGLAYGSHRTIEHFNKLIEHFPSIMEYPQAFGEYYFNNGMYEKALDQFIYIIERNSKFKKSYIYLGRIYNEFSLKSGKKLGKQYEQALKYLLEAVLLDISDPEPIFYIARTYMEHEQYQSAENEFEKILQINSNYPLIHYYIGLVNFYQQGNKNLEKALKFARTQSAKAPANYLSYKLAGDVYRLQSKGAFDKAQERQVVYELCAQEYQKALKYIKSIEIEMSIGLIECYKGAGLVDSALQLALQLIKKEGLSGYPELYKEIGSIYESKDQYENARAYYNSYFSLSPGAKDRKEIETRINKLIKEKKELSKGKEK